MKTLVTGAPGWLGSRLVEVLCSKGHQVCCLVERGKDISSLAKFPIEIIEGDLRNKPTLTRAAKDVEVVFHCAGIIHPKKAGDFYKINRDGTKNLLEASIAAGVKKFIYVSSNSAQGFNTARKTLMAEDGPCRPESNYGRSKYQAELVVKEFQGESGLQTVIIRPCLYYGPRQPERITKLMRMVKKGRPLIFGDGRNLKSMSYIDNLIDGLLLAESSKVANGKTYWIADEKPYTTVEILQEMAHALEVKIRPIYLPRFAARICEIIDILLGKLGLYSMNFHVVGESVRDIGCSIEKAKRELGYQPKIEIKEGIRRAVKWAKENNLL